MNEEPQKLCSDCIYFRRIEGRESLGYCLNKNVRDAFAFDYSPVCDYSNDEPDKDTEPFVVEHLKRIIEDQDKQIAFLKKQLEEAKTAIETALKIEGE